jgi:hypothetical protein
VRIRLSLTLNVSRSAQPASPDDPPFVDERGYAATELSSVPPIGFQIQPTNHQDPFEGEE